MGIEFDPEFRSDDGYQPETRDFAIYFLLKAGTPDKWVRFWSGENDRQLPPDDFDTAGGLYLPIGMPGGLPVISGALNGTYNVGEFAMSGVNQSAIQLLGEDRHLVNGAQIHIGLQDMGPYETPIGSVDWLGTFFAGKPGFRRQVSELGTTRTIFVPWVSGFFDRNLGRAAILSPESQRRRSPGDAACDFLPRIQAGMIIEWPAPA